EGDMVRRGLVCNLDTLSERPELRQFQHDPLRQALENRGPYVAAALTIIRAYLTAGAPHGFRTLRGHAEWSRTGRGPLAWLGQAHPVGTGSTARREGPGPHDNP